MRGCKRRCERRDRQRRCGSHQRIQAVIRRVMLRIHRAMVHRAASLAAQQRSAMAVCEKSLIHEGAHAVARGLVAIGTRQQRHGGRQQSEDHENGMRTPHRKNPSTWRRQAATPKSACWGRGGGSVSDYATNRELTRNRRVGARERGPHESFSLVSPYSSVSEPRGDSPIHNGKRNPGTWARQNLTMRMQIGCGRLRN